MKNMHWGERLDKKTLTVCFAFLMIFLVLSTICVGTVVGVNEVEMPKYSVGDKWKFSVDYKEEMGMLGTVTQEITGDSVGITQFGKSYVCYEFSFSCSGTVYGELYGQGVTGTWTMNGKSYTQKSDLSEVKDTMTTDVTFTYAGESHTMKQVIETTYDPPLESSGPLTVGKSWSAATTKTTTTQTTIDGQVDQETDTTTYTKSYLVLRTEPTTVSAGEFETFVIKATDPDGSYSESYNSPEVGGSVKQMGYDETGKLVMTMELLEYSYAAAVPPDILILSPENKTYTASSVSLGFTVDEATSWIGYSLDGQANVTITGNTTLSGLSDKAHSLIVYAKDTDENIGASEMIYFSIETARGLPLWIIIGVIIAVAAVTSGIGYVLFKRRKPTAPAAPPTSPTEQSQQSTPPLQ